MGYQFVAYDSSTITIVGTNFEVDGVPVPYGHLTAQTGTLTGTLPSGDPIFDNVFYQGGYTEPPCSVELPCSGTVSLAPPCGDGFIDGTEECDDGDTDSGDGCDEACQIEEGWECSGEPSVCSLSTPTLSRWSQLVLMAGLLAAALGTWRWRAV